MRRDKRKSNRVVQKKKLFSGFITLSLISIILILIVIVSLFMLSPKQIRAGTTKFLSFSTIQTNITKEEEFQETVPALEEKQDGVILHGARTSPKIALTFDAEMTDGMRENLLSGTVKSSYDKRITDALIQTHTKATFFLTGMWIELFPQEAKELAQNPLFELGSHSYADTSFDGDCYGLPQIPVSQDSKDIEITQSLLFKLNGVTNRYFRFPGGCYSKTNLDIVKKEKLVVVHWDVTGGDGFNNNTEDIINHVVSSTQNGSIIILHLNGAPTAPKTADALPSIIQQLKAKGFEFVTVSELLGY